MIKFGYKLMTEEHGPRELVRHAKMADDHGFEALWISDHYHPWNDEQGQSPFVWGTIGALSETVSLPITTAVTSRLSSGPRKTGTGRLSGTDPAEVFDRAIDLRITRLRRKIEPVPGDPTVIRTVRGLGYKLDL